MGISFSKSAFNTEPRKVRKPEPETRRRLIDATVKSLALRGYHGTSTVLVTQDARVSRGTLLHYFPSKSELIIAALDESVRRFGRAHKQVTENMPGDATPRDLLIRKVDIVWDYMRTPAGHAWTEILIAARGDLSLQRRVNELCSRVNTRHKNAIWELARALGATNRKAVDNASRYYMTAVRGLVVESGGACERNDEIEGALQIVRDHFLALIEQELPKEPKAA